MEEQCILAFDVGNTSLKCAVRAHGRWHRLAAVPTRPVRSLKERIAQALPARKARSLRPGRCVASSVCPAADGAVRAYWRAVGAGGEAEFFGTGLPVAILTRLRRPRQAGADRLLLALGARELHGAPCIVVGAGTAITVDLVDPEGAFVGGAIAPGFRLAARALHEMTALLPAVEPTRPRSPAGRDTVSAMQSGIYWSCAGGVLALVEQLRKEPGCARARLICTGADAPLLLPALPQRSLRHEPDLIFNGMSAALGLPVRSPAGRRRTA
jgi:type III pantothenate kinase